ncbi:molybdopterin converting factor subunit 1 [Halobacillus litoralis]|uniref:molybdopterin converting factor subunit 1 n=1 Tax=Halobacillus litoralis TaxID=45668 RepID=UPI001CFD32DF|nr:molybdopterin converting factor subunit 1 [Halobacillus litoralis]
MNKILFFAGLREVVGKEEVKWDAAGLTVADVKQKVYSEYKNDQIQSSMIAVNEEFVRNDRTIEEGDTIAFIPPVSGG